MKNKKANEIINGWKAKIALLEQEKKVLINKNFSLEHSNIYLSDELKVAVAIMRGEIQMYAVTCPGDCNLHKTVKVENIEHLEKLWEDFSLMVYASKHDLTQFTDEQWEGRSGGLNEDIIWMGDLSKKNSGEGGCGTLIYLLLGVKLKEFYEKQDDPS